MKNSKLKLNKSTIADLTTEAMLHIHGGVINNEGKVCSSKVACCGGSDKPKDCGSSVRRCCDSKFS